MPGQTPACAAAGSQPTWIVAPLPSHRQAAAFPSLGAARLGSRWPRPLRGHRRRGTLATAPGGRRRGCRLDDDPRILPAWCPPRP